MLAAGFEVAWLSPTAYNATATVRQCAPTRLDLLAEGVNGKGRLVGAEQHVPPHEEMPKIEDEAPVVPLPHLTQITHTSTSER